MSGELAAYIDEAHEDARRRLREAFGDDLSPFNDPRTDPAANYPRALHRVTLQGYFGETLGILAVEHWGAHGKGDWLVPAFLFRFHDTEFQHLDAINQKLAASEDHDPDDMRERRPGRTGDDGLAFRRDALGTITDVLVLEAKCLTRHRSDELAEAHVKLARTPRRPVGIRELIELLRDYDTSAAQSWVEALLRLWSSRPADVSRLDSVAYACGQSPKDPIRPGWMNTNAPHDSYDVQRGLEGMEFHFENLQGLIETLYRGK